MPFKDMMAVQARIFSYLKPYWKVAFGAIFFTVFVALARLSQAKLLGWLFGLMSDGEVKSATDLAKSGFEVKNVVGDGLVKGLNGQSPMQQLNYLVAAFVLLVIARGIGWYYQKYLTDLASQSAIRDIRAQVFAHLQQLSLRFFESMRLGEIQSRATSDVIAATGIYTNLADFLKNFLVVIGALGAMIYKDWQMTLLVFMLSPLIGVAVGKFGKAIGQATERLQSRVADLSAIMIENTSSQKVIKAYHREGFEIQRYEEVNEENFATQMRLVKVSATQTPVVELLSVVGIIAIVYFGTARIINGQATLASMVEYWALMAMIIQPVTVVASFYSSLHASSAAGNRAFLLIDTQPEVKDKPDAVVLPAVKGAMSFKDVRFAYDDSKEILRGVNLEVKAGEVVAIVGTNGAGKTSFVNLVPRFYDPTSGSISIDGHDLRDITVGSLRTQVGTVIQESVLFAGTIADNIACGRPDFTREQIVEASKLANADEFIARMPMGYETDIGERGVRLSGGQRQRIAIARALLREPKVLILDEFTSGIDTESENLITEAIERIMRGRTCLVIAHRLNTIRHADRIIVLDAGQIVEEGTHDVLLAKHGLYTKLYEAQLRTPVDSVDPERKVQPLFPPT